MCHFAPKNALALTSACLDMQKFKAKQVDFFGVKQSGKIHLGK